LAVVDVVPLGDDEQARLGVERQVIVPRAEVPEDQVEAGDHPRDVRVFARRRERNADLEASHDE